MEGQRTRQQTLNQKNWMLQAIASMSAGVIVTDPKVAGNPVIYVNEAFTTLTGYSEEEIIGRNCRFLQGEESDKHTIEQIRKAIQQQRSITVEIKNYRKDGTIFWNELTIDPIFAQDGSLDLFVGIQNDITIRKEKQQEILNAFFDQKALLESISDIILVADETGQLIKWNKQLNDYTDLSNKQLESKHVNDLLYQINAKQAQSLLREITETGAVEFECKLLRNNDQLIPFHWSITEMKDAKERFIGYAAVGRNITERLAIQENMKVAGDIQKNLLPADIDNQWVTIHSIYYPNQYVSGDLFAFHEEDGVLQLFLADIMGHGVATALHSSGLRVLFHQVAKKSCSLSEKLAWLNQSCFPIFNEDYYAAGFYVVFDFNKMEMSYAAAGINKFLVSSSEKTYVKKVPGMFIGMFEDAVFEEYSQRIKSGDQYYFITDGILEMMDKQDVEKNLANDDLWDYIDKTAKKGSEKDDATGLCVGIK
ncbi:PAS domain-containing protein [Bacillus tianshenii]|nr:PAS domain-containing protein [Bacillus tianshenii]